MQNKTICWRTGQKQSGWQGLSRFGGVGKQVLADLFPGYAPHFFMSCTWEENAGRICRLHNMFSMSIMRIVNKAVILANAPFENGRYCKRTGVASRGALATDPSARLRLCDGGPEPDVRQAVVWC